MVGMRRFTRMSWARVNVSEDVGREGEQDVGRHWQDQGQSQCAQPHGLADSTLPQEGCEEAERQQRARQQVGGVHRGGQGNRHDRQVGPTADEQADGHNQEHAEHRRLQHAAQDVLRRHA